MYFYPRSPYGERRCSPRIGFCRPRYFYPRSPYGERPHFCLCPADHSHFYPRSPYGERRGSVAGNWRPAIFLSTLSLRRATNLTQGVFNLFTFLSTLSLRRATRFLASWSAVLTISIHALLTESDILGALWVLSTLIFLSTLSLRRATFNLAAG